MSTKTNRWEFHKTTNGTDIHRLRWSDTADIFRLRDTRKIENDTFVVAVNGKMVGTRSSLASARTLAERFEAPAFGQAIRIA